MMVDWLTFTAPFAHVIGPGGPFYAGEVFSVSPDPTRPDVELPDWSCQKRLKLVGSWSNSIQARSVYIDGRPHVQISGNPAKLFQGHNIFGSDALPALVRSMLVQLIRARGAQPSFDDCADWSAGRIRLQRVDVTRSVDLGSVARVREAIRALELCGRLRHRGRGRCFDGFSIVFGEGSRRWSLTMYAKGPELGIKAHALPLCLAEHPQLPGYADGLLRQELRIQSLELVNLGLEYISAWSGDTVARVFGDKLESLEISEGNMADSLDIQGLPPRLRAPYLAWKAGHDVRALYSRTRFYVYRRELLNRGIDIAVRQPGDPHAGTAAAAQMPAVSLASIIKGPEAPVPEWAKGTPLYYEPPAKRGRFG